MTKTKQNEMKYEKRKSRNDGVATSLKKKGFHVDHIIQRTLTLLIGIRNLFQ